MREGVGVGQNVEASSAWWSLRHRAERAGGWSGAAATQRRKASAGKKTPGVAWGLVFVEVKESVACRSLRRDS